MIEDKRTKVANLDRVGECMETRYMNDIHKERFFQLAEIHRFKFDMSFGKAMTLRDKHKFNIFLRRIKERHGFRIIDSLVYLEERYIKFVQLLKCIDQENMHLLRVEASEINSKYKMPHNILSEFMEF